MIDGCQRKGSGQTRWSWVALGFIALCLSTPARSQQPTIDLETAYFKSSEMIQYGRLAVADYGSAKLLTQEPRREGTSLRSKLKGCDVSVQQEFLASMVFVDGKLASARVEGIKKCLGTLRYNEILSFFGVLETKAADHSNYWCSSRATCKPESSSICTTNCRALTGESVRSGVDSGYVQMSAIIERQAPDTRAEFLDRLDFAGGVLGSSFLAAGGSEEKICARGRAGDYCPGPKPGTCVPCR